MNIVIDESAKKAILEAIDEIVDKYMVERSRQGTNYFVINFYRPKDGGMETRIYSVPEDYPARVVSTTADNGDPMLQVPIPQYEDLEDVRRELMLDLTFLVGQWLADMRYIDGGKKGGKKASANLTPEKRKERASKAARARWGKRL